MFEQAIDESAIPTDDEKKLRVISKTQCAGCGRYFTGMSIFDAHRLGPATARRCMTEDEMRAAGMASEPLMVRVYHENHTNREEHEVWYDVGARETLRQVFAKMPSQGYGALPEAG